LSHPAYLINIALAIGALYLYIIGSRRFYLDKRPFLRYLGLAILIDISTAILASLKITPTTPIANSQPVPWNSILFIAHVIFACIGFFGFIGIYVTLLIKGTRKSYPRLKKFQYVFLLPVWLTGESIALINALAKYFFQVRIFDIF
jgi:hypothetical protein